MPITARMPEPDAAFLTIGEACGLIGVCPNTFKAKVLPRLSIWKPGTSCRGARIPRAEIERLANESSDEARAIARAMAER